MPTVPVPESNRWPLSDGSVAGTLQPGTERQRADHGQHPNVSAAVAARLPPSVRPATASRAPIERSAAA